MRTVYFASGWSPSQARYSGPSRPHQPGQPSAAPYPSSEVMKSMTNSGMPASFAGAAPQPGLAPPERSGRARDARTRLIPWRSASIGPSNDVLGSTLAPDRAAFPTKRPARAHRGRREGQAGTGLLG